MKSVSTTLAPSASDVASGTRKAPGPVARFTLESAAALFGRRFRLAGELGRGGMGVVYRVYDSELGIDVAAKTIEGRSPDNLYHLKREFRGLADLKHPNLVDLYELFGTPAGTFFTMEIVPGETIVAAFRRDEPDYGRLRETAFQLALGISALHGAGKLHRDVKPSNVLLTPTGRVVVLDFGLVTALDPRRIDESQEQGFAGTVLYMAPEQALGRSLTPAADWYAVGATLYEALAGVAPIEAPPHQLFLAKQRGAFNTLDRLPKEAPRELVALILELLSPDPDRRPSGSDVLDRLAGRSSRALPSFGQSSQQSPPFTNRVGELRVLESGLTSADSGTPRVVLVRGPSGIGKTELVRHFLGGARASDDITVLCGRCHPRETVAFNAFDSLVDDLSRVLERPAARAALPLEAGALRRVFPVLGRVEGLRELSDEPDLNAANVRRRAIEALRMLLSTLSLSRPVILWFDDVQWADVDSAILLRDVLRPPRAPRALVILGYRSDTAPGDFLPILEAPETGLPSAWIERLDVAPLGLADSLELARALVGSRSSVSVVEQLVRDAQGMPLFLCELAGSESGDYVADRDAARTSLADLLRRRALSLAPEERRLAEIAAVAGGPLLSEVLVRAAELDDHARVFLARLESARIVRTGLSAGARHTEVFHDRVRVELLSMMSDDERRARHRSVAAALVEHGADDLSRVVEHYDAAGDEEAVRRWVVPAARQASASLAFDRAAGLYRLAARVGSADLEKEDLQARLGEALALAGRERDAAAAYEEGSRLAVEMGREPDRVRFFARRAVDHYLRAGAREDGLRVLGQLLGRLGLFLPKGRGRVLIDLVRYQRALTARGFEFRVQSEADVSPEVLERLDTLWALRLGFALIDHELAAALNLRHLLEALDVGEPSRLAQSLAVYGVLESARGGAAAFTAADQIFQRVDEVIRPLDDDRLEAGRKACIASARWFEGRFAECVRLFDESNALYKKTGSATAFEVDVGETFRLSAMGLLGRYRDLRNTLEERLTEARAREDALLIETCGAGTASVGWIAAGDLGSATRWAEEVLRRSPHGYSSPRYRCLLTFSQVDLYKGDGRSALERIGGDWWRLRTLGMLSVSYVRDELRHLRARAALAARAARPSSRLARFRLERMARRDAASLRAGGLAVAAAWADLVHAGLAFQRGFPNAAIARLEAALGEFERLELAGYREVTRYRLGRATGRRDLVAASEEWAENEGVCDMAALARMLAPGVGD